ncbi:MAG: hypothetical protein F4X76_13720, partial [Chloroflexi bacterium]|nr:hypothetical protein [Chloroflexota bacterium]
MTSRHDPRSDPLGVLIGTERGLWQLLPGEPLRCILPDLAISSIDVRGEVALAAAAGRRGGPGAGGRAAAWRLVGEGAPRVGRTPP